MIGALRAKITGAALRKVNSLLRAQKVALVIINQIRSKVGVIYGSSDVLASGGKSLEYYLAVNLKTISNKTSDVLEDEAKRVIGIKGRVVNTKNKIARPFQECEFELLYDKGLTKEYGLLKMLEEDGYVVKNSSWYSCGTKKFQSADFLRLLSDKNVTEFEPIRKLLNLI
jgi:recombination protein RecA